MDINNVSRKRRSNLQALKSKKDSDYFMSGKLT